ncbi:hypothetical protein KC342_g15923 [Hortaea werneckii]|nr:hypothetical protein KC342_g15923 [Hortaea werneckii]
MSNPRIEEVDEDVGDPDEMDVDAFDFARPQQGGLQQAPDPSQSRMTPEAMQQMFSQGGDNPFGNFGRAAPQQQQQMSQQERMQREREYQEKSKHYQCIYPVYFDSSRSREEGRRVKKEDAVANPLARTIVDALSHVGQSRGVGLQIVFEPHKMHPKDWANPGRVRVQVKKDGKPVSAKIANKHYLYKLVAEYLKQHPTTEEDSLRFKFQGMPPPKDNKLPKPAIPKGWKMGEILPLHSPALSGGGVSDNMFKDMMAEMGGGGGMPGMPGMPGMGGLPGMGGGGAGPSGGGGGNAGGQQKKVKVGKKK